MRDLNAFQRDLLHIIAGLDEPAGTEVHQEVSSYYQRNVNRSQLYPYLDKLVELGFVEKGKHDGRTNSYRITEEGKKRLDRRAAWENKYYRPRPSPPTLPSN